jgi:hypothetical protein|eukprot:29125-Pelagococcus_subviridis.AAC.2
MEYHHAYDAHAMPHVTNPPHLEDFEQAALETLLMPPPPPLASRGGRDASFSPDVGLGGERAGAARDAYALASTSGGRPPLREMDDPRETFEREFKVRESSRRAEAAARRRGSARRGAAREIPAAGASSLLGNNNLGPSFYRSFSANRIESDWSPYDPVREVDAVP